MVLFKYLKQETMTTLLINGPEVSPPKSKICQKLPPQYIIIENRTFPKPTFWKAPIVWLLHIAQWQGSSQERVFNINWISEKFISH